MLTKIPIDIVEMVIVSSDEYGLFKELRMFLPKLQEFQRLARINDKMTHFYNNGYYWEYKLNGMFHREYDKPCLIKLKSFYAHEYRKFGKL